MHNQPITQHHSSKFAALSQELQGNCQINTIQILTFSYFKSLTLGSILILSIIGAILLYNFKKLRVWVFYTAANDLSRSTHVYIKDEQEREDIEKITQLPDGTKQFSFKKLRYWITQGLDYHPVCFDSTSQTRSLSQILSAGLNSNEVLQRREIYGLNEHTVDTPNYFEYMVSVIFTPLYLLQYFVVLILSLQGLPLMGIILVIVSIITTSGNYIALYFSNKKIKEIAEKSHSVKVLRSGTTREIDSKELVPGDVLIIQNAEMSCDAVLIEGDAYMNEHSLTGQSVPVAKTKVLNLKGDLPNNSMLFEGTLNIEVGQDTRALVLRTGFTTRKGKILRQILNRIPQQPDFFKKAVLFLIFSGIVAVILFFCIVKVKLDSNIDRSLVWLGVINFLLNAIPPAFPIYFTMAYSWSIYRLKQDNILTTMPQKTVESNRLRISCFDKTGTLTENNIDLEEIYLYERQFKEVELINKSSEIYRIMNMLFGTCHTVRRYGNQLLGDQVDLRMYQHSKFIKANSSSGDVYLQNNAQLECEVIKVHQFQSRYQSMSVLVHDRKTNKFYCFSKGAPEKMISVSTIKIPKYDQIIANLALKGLRTIGFSYKELTPSEVLMYKNCEREKFLENSKLIGLVTFQNALKFDTTDTISQLKEAQIECKMITGDGIFIAVQTAIRTGIIQQNQRILVIEGRKQQKTSNGQICGLVLKKTSSGYEQQNYTINFNEPHKLRGLKIALDNDYLNMNPPVDVFLTACIFARVVPQNKAKIIKLLKENLISQWEGQSLVTKIFGEGRQKISMAGDGANDLLAIKEADVGVGISDSDASYGAAFTVKDLGQIINIVKEGKCTTQNIIENLRYVLIVNFMNITADILCSTQSTFLSTMMALFLNFFMITTLPIISAYSKPNPQSKLTRHSARDNFMAIENHLLTWGNIIILVLGMIGGFFYITRLQNYVPNPKPFWILGEGYYPDCQLVTAIFLLLGFPLTSVAIVVYKSEPWKNPIYKNIVLMVMIVVNFIIMAVFYIGNSLIAGLFGTVALPSAMTLFILFLISVSTQAGAFIHTYLIGKWWHPEYEEQGPNTSQKVQITQTNIDINLIPANGH